MTNTNHGVSELGDFLRSRRERLRPTELKRPSGRKRRTPGLRREEVAQLAGIGVDWYIRMEQGRAVSPSNQTIDALARALRLTKVDHAHLRALAQKSSTRDSLRVNFTRETVPPTLHVVLKNMRQPAYITGQRCDVLAWNTAANKLFSFSQRSETERNMILCMLTDPSIRCIFGNAWTQEAQRMVAEFRAAYDQWSGDPAFLELLKRLHKESSEFSPWWKALNHRKPAAVRKALIPPKCEATPFNYVSFQTNDAPSIRLVVLGKMGQSQ